MVGMFFSPEIKKRILEMRREPPTKQGKAGHFVCNFNQFEYPIVTKRDVQFGRICNPLEISAFIPRHGFGEGSRLRWRNKRGGRGTNLRNISRIHQRQEEQAKQFNLAKTKRFRPCKILRKDIYPIIIIKV